ncbi:phage tail protein [Flavobacterium anhuiense]|uniref:phage tail protein n=1 Tax=Flavobacterium anhuiense TaxID=459526 RepID=UPI003D999402
MKKNYLLTFLLILSTNFLSAQAIGYLGEIRLFAGTFAPKYWAICDGSLLPINRYSTLYSVIGNQYGGDGISTFAVPDLRSRVPVGAGQLPGGSNYIAGDQAGQENITLLSSEMPLHAHSVAIAVSNENASTTLPTSTSSIAVSGMNSGRAFVTNSGYSTTTNTVDIQSITTNPTGSGQPLQLSRPSLGLIYIIALEGYYPTRQ